MQKAIEILLIIGVFANLIKAGELVLRPHQQKWLQEKWDSLTLWLDYARPLNILNKTRVLQLIFSGMSYMVIPMVILLFMPFLPIPLWVKLLWSLLVLFFCYDFYVKVYMPAHSSAEFIFESFTHRNKPMRLVWLVLTGGEIETRSMKYIVECKTSRQYFIRILILLMLSLLFFAFLGGIFQASQWVFHACHVGIFQGRLLTLLGIAIFFIPALTVLFISIACLFIILISLGMFITEIVLIVIRSVTWRIAEYNKGAWAGIVLALTALLGAWEAYLKYIK